MVYLSKAFLQVRQKISPYCNDPKITHCHIIALWYVYFLPIIYLDGKLSMESLIFIMERISSGLSRESNVT